MNQQNTNKNQPHIIQVATTEHYNLQSGRSMTVSDANGRSGLFLSTVSMTLIALSFIGQVSHLGQAFFVFAFVLFPSLFFFGIVTFERVLQSAIEDVIYARGINRIRHLYIEIAPEIKDYFILSAHDDDVSVYSNMATKATRWQAFLTTPGMIGVLTSILGGVFIGLLSYRLFTPFLQVSIGAGVGASLVLSMFFHRYQWVTWGKAQKRIPSLFPVQTPKE